jgi:hypothetical protein
MGKSLVSPSRCYRSRIYEPIRTRIISHMIGVAILGSRRDLRSMRSRPMGLYSRRKALLTSTLARKPSAERDELIVC